MDLLIRDVLEQLKKLQSFLEGDRKSYSYYGFKEVLHTISTKCFNGVGSQLGKHNKFVEFKNDLSEFCFDVIDRDLHKTKDQSCYKDLMELSSFLPDFPTYLIEQTEFHIDESKINISGKKKEDFLKVISILEPFVISDLSDGDVLLSFINKNFTFGKGKSSYKECFPIVLAPQITADIVRGVIIDLKEMDEDKYGRTNNYIKLLCDFELYSSNKLPDSKNFGKKSQRYLKFCNKNETHFPN